MLNLKLQLTDEMRRSVTRTGSIRNVGTTHAPRLATELALGNGEPSVTSTCEMPFTWELTVPQVVVHCLATTLARDSSPRLDVRKSMGTAQVSVRRGSRVLVAHTAWRVYEDMHDEAGEWEPLGRRAVTAWQLAMLMLQRPREPAFANAKTPLPPVYFKAQRSYCRVSDLPAELQKNYWTPGCLQSQPMVKGVADAVYPHDMARFLALHN